MIPTDSLLSFIVASALLSLAPGPDNLVVLMQSIQYGKKAGLFFTLGLCTGLLGHTGAVALGLAALLQVSTWAWTALKILGAGYLAYLSWRAFKASARSLLGAKTPHAQSLGALYLRGIVMNLANPKVSLFFLAFLPQFTASEQGSMTIQIFLLGGLFILVALFIFSAIALSAGMIGDGLQRIPSIQVWLNRVAGTLFGVLALRLFWASKPN